MAVIRVAIVEFCRWIFGGGRLHFSSSFSSKSKFTVLSAFLIFLVVVTASLFALSSSSLFSSSSFSSSSPSSSSSTLLSWFFSPSAANISFNPTPPTPPPPLPPPPPPPPSPAPQERKEERDGVISEGGHGSANLSSGKSPLSGKELEQGSRRNNPSHTANSTKNSTLVLATDTSSSGQIPKEVALDNSNVSESPSSNITSCGGLESGNSTTRDVCFKGQILGRKNATGDQDHQIKEQHQEEKNEVGGRLSGSVEAAAGMDVATVKSNSSSSSVEAKAPALPIEVKALSDHSESAPCDMFNGRWVWDEKSEPYYPPGSCPYLDDDFNCHKNGRPDSMFLKWRWQPYGCDIPRLNASDFLQRLRGKRLVFVGDSLNRNMWESLVCILRNSIKNKNRVFEVSGRRQFKTKGRRRQSKTKGYYSFKFADYGCSVDFVRSTFLVKEVPFKNENGLDDEKLRLDLLDETTVAYKEADVIVFNTGHWWTHEKTSRGINYYQEGNHVYPVLKVLEAYKRALTTWARWIDKNIDSRKTQVFFRGYSLTHFRGGQWNSGGQCHKETEPIFNQTYLAKYPSKMRALEYILKDMRTPVLYLNISRLTDYRKDGHPSVYRQRYASVEEQIAAERSQDCSHWCLPGVPDSWNELLYASLLVAGKGSWGR